jgi:hypothetical protein
MAKGPVITEKVRQIIAETYLQHRDWRAKEIQNDVDNRLNGNGPGLSAIQKILTRMREKEEEERTLNQGTGLDVPWSLGSLGMKPEYELPPGIIPLVLELKRTRDVDLKMFDPNLPINRARRTMSLQAHIGIPGKFVREKNIPPPLSPLSLREAKWVARISNVLSGKITTKEIGWWASYYSDYERSCELAGVTCDTSELDSALSMGDLWGYSTWASLRTLPGRAKEEAEDIEHHLFGHTLDYFKLSVLSWDVYCTWLTCIIYEATKWRSLSRDGQESLVKRLRAWAGKQEQIVELRRPDQLLEEAQYVSPIAIAIGNNKKRTRKESK